MNREIFHEMALKAKDGKPIVNVCLEEIESLRQQLDDRQQRVTTLRDALEFIPTSGSILGYAAEKKRTEALAATEPK